VMHVMVEGRVLQLVEDRARAALDGARPYRRVERGHLVRVVAWALLPAALIQPGLDLRRRDVLLGCQNGAVCLWSEGQNDGVVKGAGENDGVVKGAGEQDGAVKGAGENDGAVEGGEIAHHSCAPIGRVACPCPP